MPVRGSNLKIDVSDGKVTIDASDLAPLLELEADDLRAQMRNGDVRILSESGEGDDAGRHRVTFWTQRWRVRLTCDADGTVLKQSRARVGT